MPSFDALATSFKTHPSHGRVARWGCWIFHGNPKHNKGVSKETIKASTHSEQDSLNSKGLFSAQNHNKPRYRHDHRLGQLLSTMKVIKEGSLSKAEDKSEEKLKGDARKEKLGR